MTSAVDRIDFVQDSKITQTETIIIVSAIGVSILFIILLNLIADKKSQKSKQLYQIEPISFQNPATQILGAETPNQPKFTEPKLQTNSNSRTRNSKSTQIHRPKTSNQLKFTKLQTKSNSRTRNSKPTQIHRPETLNH